MTEVVASIRMVNFFHLEASPFAYEESTACEWFPKSKEDVRREGYNEMGENEVTKYEFSEYTIPDNIKDVGDEILGEDSQMRKKWKGIPHHSDGTGILSAI